MISLVVGRVGVDADDHLGPLGVAVAEGGVVVADAVRPRR